MAFILPAVSFASIDINLKYGAQGTEVKELQEFLIDKGFLAGQTTGNFFTLTRKAVIAYQGSVGLPTTGFVGPMTREKVNVELSVADISSNISKVTETGSTLPPIQNDSKTAIQKQIENLLAQITQMNSQILQLNQNTQTQLQQTAQIVKNTTPTTTTTTPVPQPVPTPTPTPSPAPISDTTKPILTSGPTAVVTSSEDGIYTLNRIDYTTNEPTTMVFNSTWNKSYLMGHFCNDVKLLPSSIFNCVLKVSDTSGNVTEAPFSFTTGPGVFKITTVPSGFGTVPTGRLYRARFTDTDTKDLKIKSFTFKIWKSKVLSMTSITPIFYKNGFYYQTEGKDDMIIYPSTPVSFTSMLAPYDALEEAIVTVNLSPSQILESDLTLRSVGYALSFELIGNTSGPNYAGIQTQTWLTGVEFEGESPTVVGLNTSSTAGY